MSDNSFYGGLRGASFIIVARYPSIADMIKAFAGGGSYTVVNYDEYVIIDTENKNDPDNGKIFRRGYSYNDEMGGAQYIGQVVGPAGLAPMVEMTTYKEAEEKQAEEGYAYRKSFGEYAPVENLIPGKMGEGTEESELEFNDSIKWYCTSIRDNFNRDTTAYIGFIFPYLVVDYTADSVSPYYNRSSAGADFINERLVDREDDGKHPYWEKWHISVPKGIKGDTFKNLRVIQASVLDNVEPYESQEDDYSKDDSFIGREILVYDYYHYDKDGNGEPVSIYLGDNNMIDNVQFSDDGTITVVYTHDDTAVWPNLIKWIKSVTLNPDNGDFDVVFNYGDGDLINDTHVHESLTWVKDITVDEEGSIVLHYTNLPDDEEKYYHFLKWITGVELDTETGEFDITFNYGDGDLENNTHFHKDLTWLKELSIDAGGSVHYTYTTSDNDWIDENKLKWITSLDLNTENGNFDVFFNYGDEDTHVHRSLTWVKDIEILDSGTVIFHYTNKDDKSLDDLIKWIEYVELNAETGHFSVVYNHQKDKYGEPTQYDIDLTWVKQLQLAHDGTITVTRTTDTYNLDEQLRWIDEIQMGVDGTINVIYNTGESTSFDNSIQWISSVELDAEGHFRVEYNNGAAAYETDLVWIGAVELADDGTVKFIENNGIEHTYEKYLKHVTDIKVNEDNQNLHVTYNTGDEEDIGQPLNYIVEVVVCPDDYHLLIYYSDPALRENVVSAGKNHEYQGKNDWLDLGSIKDENGILIGLNIDENEVEDFKQDTVIAYLNEHYPQGLTEIGLMGKVATAGHQREEKKFYAFDYDAESWYYLGTITVNISIDDDGTIYIGPRGDETAIYENMMKWIDSVSLAQDGIFIVHYNNNSPDYETQIKWVEDVIVNDDASISVKYNNGDKDTKYENWIDAFADRLVTFASEKQGAPENLITSGIWYVVDGDD